MKIRTFVFIVASLFATVVSAQGVGITEKGGKEVISLMICVFTFMVGILSPRWNMATTNRLLAITAICATSFLTIMMILNHYFKNGLIVMNAVWFVVILLAVSGIFFGEGGVSVFGAVVVVAMLVTLLWQKEWTQLLILSVCFLCGIRSRVLSEREKLTTVNS